MLHFTLILCVANNNVIMLTIKKVEGMLLSCPHVVIIHKQRERDSKRQNTIEIDAWAW